MLTWAQTPTAQQREAELQKRKAMLRGAKAPADSLRLLYDIFDLSRRKDYKDVGKTIYEVAGRAGDNRAQMDMCRQLTAALKEDADFEKIQNVLEKMPKSRERDESILFLKMKRMSYNSKYVSEEKRQQEISRIIAREETSRSKNPYDRLLSLYTVVEYLRNDATGGGMISKYLDDLIKLVNDGDYELYALRNIIYSEAANIYTDMGQRVKAVDADEKLLEVIDGLDKEYRSKGRMFRDYSVSRYVSYRRMMRNYEALTPARIKEVDAKVRSLSKASDDVREDLEYQPRYKSYWLMATGDYAAAIPQIKALLDKETSVTVRRQLYDMLWKAASETGDNQTLIEALTQYNGLLTELNTLNAENKYKELQIRYDVDDLKQRNTRLELEKRTLELESARRIMIYVIIGFVLFAIAVIVMLYYWSRYRRNIAGLNNLVKALSHERENLQGYHYYDYAAKDEPKSAKCELKRARNISVSMAEMSTVNMEEILNDILYIASIGREHSRKYHSCKPVATIMTDAADLCRAKLHDDVNLHVELPDSSLEVCCDCDALKYILSRILANSAEYTYEGEIKFSVRVDDETGRLKFSVVDTGLRFKPGEEYALFDEFVTIDSLRDNPSPGLFVCRLAALLLESDIKSHPGHKRGMNFVMSVPQKID